ncbi:hypothetical protein GUITHDRAFT_150391 [Guillardia theta CCMP2712]|uniref:RING-type domain-containing protein n=1 Tax=Guillardia theta (strain CCMP2712) TaxID=905079 RepID=L1JXT1_GUITC|nr:hypothetical protein GUITHDRAFT_150391 [Guillardia theta CCMP2712]EKX53371.1 hypothetical protein GUITHDRAFT_150391 [Guillardia theta CCMP2712]|eukprot:XP_005840351.1 hypothetical protein GUITHDRAFT_150391 [Guillardia theta CCMP2712]
MSDGAENEAWHDCRQDADVEDVQFNLECDESSAGNEAQDARSNTGASRQDSSNPVQHDRYDREVPAASTVDNSWTQSQQHGNPFANMQTFQFHGFPGFHGGVGMMQHGGNFTTSTGVGAHGMIIDIPMDQSIPDISVGVLGVPVSVRMDSLDLFAGDSENFFNNFDPLLQAMQASFNLSQGYKPKASARALEFVPAIRLEKGETIECPICADVLRDGDWGARMPCGHYFSLEELAKWLAVNNTCPVCRFELPSTDEEYNRNKKLSYEDLRNSFENICKAPNDIMATRINSARQVFLDGVLSAALDEVHADMGEENVHRSGEDLGAKESKSCCKCFNVDSEEIEEELQQLADHFLFEQVQQRQRMEVMLDLD